MISGQSALARAEVTSLTARRIRGVNPLINIVSSTSRSSSHRLEVTNTSSAGNNLGIYVTTSYVNITHNTIHHIETDCGDNGGGITVAGRGSSDSNLHNITINGNLIYDINYRGGSPSCPASTVQSDGILVESAGTANQVTNNIVYHTSGGWGILVGNSNNAYNNVNSVISNNTVFSTTVATIIVSRNRPTLP